MLSTQINNLLFVVSVGVIVFVVAWTIRGIAKAVIFFKKPYEMDSSKIKNLLATLNQKGQASLSPQAQARIKSKIMKGIR